MAEHEKAAVLENDLKGYPAVLDPNQVADILGVSRKTVDGLIAAGVIEAFPLDPNKERKQYRVTKANLIAYITNKNSN